MKIVNLFLISIICLTLGCSPKIIDKKEVGNLVSIDVVPTSFNEMAKSRIETTEAFYMVIGTPTGRKGEKVYHIRTNQGDYLKIGPEGNWHRIRIY